MNKQLFFNILKFELSVLTKTKSFWLISLIPPIALILMFIVNYNSGHTDSVLVENHTTMAFPIEPTATLQVQYGTNKDWQKDGYDAYIRLYKNKNGSVACIISSAYVLHPTSQQAIRNSLETKMSEAQLGVDLSKVKAQISKKVKLETRIENPRYKLMGISMASIFLTYLIVLQFASAILRMSGREKVNKISEILLSAMSPRIIMGGKLIACLLAAFLQLTVWCLVSICAIFLAIKILAINLDQQAIESLIQMIAFIPTQQLVEFALIYALYLIGGFCCIAFCSLSLGPYPTRTPTHSNSP